MSQSTFKVPTRSTPLSRNLDKWVRSSRDGFLWGTSNRVYETFHRKITDGTDKATKVRVKNGVKEYRVKILRTNYKVKK